MRLIKYTHACVRLERDGRKLLIDPGVYSEREAYDGVSAILVTHEHSDHVNLELLPSIVDANPDLRIYTSAAVGAQLASLGDAVVTVSIGETFTAQGFNIQAVGGVHAEIYDGLPGVANLGYIVDGEIYHPGDALYVPTVPVPNLLVPVHAPWLKIAEMIDFLRAVAPSRAFPIHDAALNESGQQSADNWAKLKGQTDYERIPVGSAVDL
jgi:L-ascorbate metabolism protein UlaG (beta-lactamase superfamily)